MLEKIFEMIRQRWRAKWIAQFVNDHRRLVRFFEQTLRDAGVSIDPSGIDRPNPAARNRGDVEAPIVAAGREQLHRVAGPDLEKVRQSITDNHAGGVVAKIVEEAIDNLFGEIGCAQMRSCINPVKIGGGCFKSGARADCAAKHRRTGSHVRKLPAYSHDLAHVVDPFEIISARGGGAGIFRRDHHSLIARLKSRPQNKRAIAPDRRVDEELREALRLRLGANEDSNTEDDANQAQ